MQSELLIQCGQYMPSNTSITKSPLLHKILHSISLLHQFVLSLKKKKENLNGVGIYHKMFTAFVGPNGMFFHRGSFCHIYKLYL